MKHTKEEIDIIRKFEESIDDEILEFVEKIYNGDEASTITVGMLSDNTAKSIEELTGKKVYGNRVVLDKNGVMHIKKRHGENGEHDESMKDIRNIARIGYVLANYDFIDFNDKYAKGYVDSKGKLAPIVTISKKINGTFYIVEAVSDAKKHKNYIVSAYIRPRK